MSFIATERFPLAKAAAVVLLATSPLVALADGDGRRGHHGVENHADREDRKGKRDHHRGDRKHDHRSYHNHYGQWYQPYRHWRGGRYGHHPYEYRVQDRWKDVDVYAHDRGYKEDRKDRRHHKRHKRGWVEVDRFHTLSVFRSESVIPIHQKVSAISLTGLKRDARIRHAWVEFGNGRRKPLRSLEGKLRDGESAKHRFRNDRYVKRLILDVRPDQRLRAAIGVDVRLS